MLWETTWDNAVFLNIRGTRIYYIIQSVMQKKKPEVSSDNTREESNLAAARKNDFMAASW